VCPFWEVSLKCYALHQVYWGLFGWILRELVSL
jgi:hypothetical protein